MQSQQEKSEYFDTILHKSESGEAKLTRGSRSLDIAKREAQKTLAPILDRMRKSRKIRSADKVLSRLSSTLEYPHRMQRALDKEDYNEVINIYQRIQAIPTTSSLRVLQRVRESAENIIKNAKNKCLSVLLSSNYVDINILMHHAKILKDLEGEESYRENLKQCFGKQCSVLMMAIHKIHYDFIQQVNQDYSSIVSSDKNKSNKVINGNMTILSQDVEQEIVHDIKRRIQSVYKNSTYREQNQRKGKEYHTIIDRMYHDSLMDNDENHREQDDDFNIIFERDMDSRLLQDEMSDGINYPSK